MKKKNATEVSPVKTTTAKPWQESHAIKIWQESHAIKMSMTVYEGRVHVAFMRAGPALGQGRRGNRPGPPPAQGPAIKI